MKIKKFKWNKIIIMNLFKKKLNNKMKNKI